MIYRYFKAVETYGEKTPELEADAILKALSERLMKDYNLSVALEKIKWEGLVDLEEERVDGLSKILEQIKETRAILLQTYTLEHILDKIQNDIALILRNDIKEQLLNQPLDTSGLDSQGHRLIEDTFHKVSQWVQNDFPNKMAETIADMLCVLPPESTAAQKVRAVHDDLWHKTTGFNTIIHRELAVPEKELEVALQELIDFIESTQKDKSGDALSFMTKHSHIFNFKNDLNRWIQNILKKRHAIDQLLMDVSFPIRLSLEGMANYELASSDLVQSLQAFWKIAKLNFSKKNLKKHPYTGDRSLDLDDALSLEERMHKLEELENQIQSASINGNISEINTGLLGEMLGELAENSLNKLNQIVDVLIDRGYLQLSDDKYLLTSKALRRIGELALADIFSDFHWSKANSVSMKKNRTIHSFSGETKDYEFGDLINLNLSSTLFNALRRHGARTPPISIAPLDFEIYKPELISKNTTVLLIDISSSMDDKFAKAKKVVLALKQLISHYFPGDTLKIVAFYSLAKSLNIKEVFELTPMPFYPRNFQKRIDYRQLKELERKGGADFPGDFTNIQEGLRMAREILSRDKNEEKHIFLITDGEPSACIKDATVYLECPATTVIFEETIKEVKKCTLNDIKITTFMLSDSEPLQDFVKLMGKINKGKAFFTPPDEIDQYVVVDYLRKKSYQIK